MTYYESIENISAECSEMRKMPVTVESNTRSVILSVSTALQKQTLHKERKGCSEPKAIAEDAERWLSAHTPNPPEINTQNKEALELLPGAGGVEHAGLHGTVGRK